MFRRAKLALSSPSPFSGEGRPQRSGGRGGGDVRTCSAERPPPDRPSAGHPPHKWGRDEDADVIASASEAIHGSASQDRRWIASSLPLPCANASRLSQAKTTLSFLRKQEPIRRVGRLRGAVQ